MKRARALPARASRWAPALIMLVACAANLRSLAPGFIHDDHRIIEQNELIRGLDHLPRILTHGYWSVDARSVPNLYRPITILSFALDEAVGGLRPLGFRVVNLVLHAIVCLLVFLLGRRILAGGGGGGAGRVDDPAAAPARGPALLAALLFAVHPVHTEVLGEVVGRAELLAALGSIGSVLAFLAGRDLQAQGRTAAARGAFALSLAAFAAGFLAKENAVAAPFLALVADRLVVRRPPDGGRPAWGFHMTAAGALALCLLARAEALGSLNPPGLVHFIDNPIAHLPFLPGRLTALKVVARYALLLVAPVRLSIDYSYDAIPAAGSLADPWALAGLALVLGWAAAIAFAWRRFPAMAFSLSWIGVTLAPVSNLLVPIGTIMAERLLYLPSAGLCLLAGGALARLRLAPDQPLSRTLPAVQAAAALLLAACAIRGVSRLGDWKDDYTIFGRAIEVVPRSVRALYNFGAACEERGEDPEAARVYRRAIELWPGFADAHYNLAGICARQRRWDEAVGHYREAVRQQPANLQYMVNLGRGLNGQGRPAEAREVLQSALLIDPQNAMALTNLGAAELQLGNAGAAVRAYAEAARLDPASADYQRNLALAQQQSGDRAAARESYRRGLALRPDDPDLLAGLGIACLEAGDPGEAVSSLEAAVRLRPAQPIFRYQLGRALEGAGRAADAVSMYRESARLAPTSPIPLKTLGLLLDRLGDRRGALEALARAESLDPQGKVLDAPARRLLRRLRVGAGGEPPGRPDR